MKRTLEIVLCLFISVFYDDIHCNPIKGITNCLNNDDCLGSNRRCHRNSTLLTGICTCMDGFLPAKNDRIACLNIKIRECVDATDCPPNFICHTRPHYLSFRESLHQMDKVCIFPFNSETASIMGIDGPRIGGGLRSSHIYDHFFVGRRNRIHPPFHPEYIKFVEDAMLVLFLICVLVTLLIVHRASCFRNARRNGVLRYIIPHSDDVPPPYSQYGPPASTEVNQPNTESEGATTNSREVNASRDTRDTPGRGLKSNRPETPPPSYAEALLISQAASASLLDAAEIRRTDPGGSLPIYVALPPRENEEEEENTPRLNNPCSSQGSD